MSANRNIVEKFQRKNKDLDQFEEIDQALWQGKDIIS
jgi:hypothetical protein